MSQENVEIARRALAEFGASSAQIEEAASAGLVSPDAELDFSALYPDGPIIRGLEAWRGFVDSLPWGRSLKLEPERFFDVDDERGATALRLASRLGLDHGSATTAPAVVAPEGMQVMTPRHIRWQPERCSALC